MTQLDQTDSVTEIRLRLELSDVEKRKQKFRSGVYFDVPLRVYWKSRSRSGISKTESLILNSQVDAALRRYQELLLMEPNIQDQNET